MYFLVEGEVGLSARGKPSGTVRAGEIFGEMAAISDSPRSATAVARTSCRVIALDDRQFHAALQNKPEFALMMLGVLTARLRGMIAGQTGALMYVVLEGRVAISIRGAVLERIGPGGVFGEMALIDQSPRAADAVAETDCALLAVSRTVFLNLVKSEPAFGSSLLSSMAERVRSTAAGVN